MSFEDQYNETFHTILTDEYITKSFGTTKVGTN